MSDVSAVGHDVIKLGLRLLPEALWKDSVWNWQSKPGRPQASATQKGREKWKAVSLQAIIWRKSQQGSREQRSSNCGHWDDPVSVYENSPVLQHCTHADLPLCFHIDSNNSKPKPSAVWCHFTLITFFWSSWFLVTLLHKTEWFQSSAHGYQLWFFIALPRHFPPLFNIKGLFRKWLVNLNLYSPQAGSRGHLNLQIWRAASASVWSVSLLPLWKSIICLLWFAGRLIQMETHKKQDIYLFCCNGRQSSTKLPLVVTFNISSP